MNFLGISTFIGIRYDSNTSPQKTAFILFQKRYKKILLFCLIVHPAIYSQTMINELENDELEMRKQKIITNNNEQRFSSKHPLSIDIYTGTPTQNRALLLAGEYSGNSIVDALKSVGINSSFENRKYIYRQTFIQFSEKDSVATNSLINKNEKFLHKSGYIYIESNLEKLPVYINKKFIGTTPIYSPIKLDYGEYKIWCIPPASKKLPNGKTMVLHGNFVSYVIIDSDVQTFNFNITQNFATTAK